MSAFTDVLTDFTFTDGQMDDFGARHINEGESQDIVKLVHRNHHEKIRFAYADFSFHIIQFLFHFETDFYKSKNLAI